MSINIETITRQFNLDNDINEYGNGHINDTYVTNPSQYILQRINSSVFTNPTELMKNVEKVTKFLKKKITMDGGNPERETMTIIKTFDRKNLYRYDDNNYFRVYKFVENSLAIETPEGPEDLYEAAKGFAKFQKRLADFPVETLFETIKDFHNTPVRFENLKKAISENKAGRVSGVKEEIDFALAQGTWIGVIVQGLNDGSIPLRVTHNDTKINNILFDAATRKALCVIDLDTVMPGSMLYDFGDALRIGAATAPEDETDLDKMSFNLESFEAFARGFAEELADTLTEREVELLPLSAKLLTYECGIRFLTDYLNGDTYFKIHRPNQNLDRARAHFKLVRDIDSKMDKMTEIINKLFK